MRQARWTHGIGTHNETIFGLAVQLLTVPSLLPILHREADVLGTLLRALRDMLLAASQREARGDGSIDLKHHCIAHSRYRHVVQVSSSAVTATCALLIALRTSG